MGLNFFRMPDGTSSTGGTPTDPEDLAAETARAIAAESALADDLAEEAARAQAAEADLAASIASGGASGGGTGAGEVFSYYDPDKPHESPSEIDDEFDQAALHSKWTPAIVENATYDINTSKPSALKLTPSTAGMRFWLAQSIPDGDFCIMTRVHFTAYPGNYEAAGLFLSNSLVPGSSYSATVIEIVYNSNEPAGYGIQVGNMSGPNWGTWSTVYMRRAAYGYDAFIRIRRVGTTYYVSWSTTGADWCEECVFSLSYTPTHFGLEANHTNGHASPVSWDWFRYLPSGNAVNAGGVRDVGTVGTAVLPDWLLSSPDCPPSAAGIVDNEFGASLSDFAWVNQGNASAALAGGRLCLTTTPTVNGDANRLLLKPIPSSEAWTVTTKIGTTCKESNAAQTGIALYSSANGKLITFGPSYNSGASPKFNIQNTRWNSPTSWNSHTFAGWSWANGAPIYLRLRCDGTNIAFEWSPNGSQWITTLTESKTAFITGGPTHIGYAMNVYNANEPLYMVADWFRSLPEA